MRRRTRPLAVLLLAALVPALASCATSDAPDDVSATPIVSESADVGSLSGTAWDGTMDGNHIALLLEDDGTVRVEKYNGTGPFDVDDDVWEVRDGVLVMTLTGLYVQGENPRIVNVTVRGEVDAAALELAGEYSDGAPASMRLTASVS